MKQYFNSAMHFLQLLLICLRCLKWFGSNFELLSFTVWFLLRHPSSCDSSVCRTWSGPTARESAQSGSSRYETALCHSTNYADVPKNRRGFSALFTVRSEGGEDTTTEGVTEVVVRGTGTLESLHSSLVG